jgi:hypothetical protein
LEEQLGRQKKEFTEQLTKQQAEQRLERAREKEKIAANMLREGIAPAVAVKVTGLSLKKVSALQKNLAR